MPTHNQLVFMKRFLSLVVLSMFLAGCGEEASESGAGGAGPGYDGSRKGSGKEGTVPAPGSGVGAGVTNSAATNR